jgi:hypothetical protein
MSVPKFGAVIDALVALARTTSAQEVHDGPVIATASTTDYVVIGGTEDPDDEPSSFTQDWNGLGARTKNETGEVTCAVLVGTGGEDVKTARDRALVIVAEVETLIRADPSLGGVLSGGWCLVSGGQHVQRLNTQGLYVRVVFTVSYQTKN